LSDIPYDIDLLCKYNYFLSIQIEDSYQTAEEVRFVIFEFFFFEMSMFIYLFGLSLYFKDGGDATAIEIGYDDESLFADPYCYGL